MFTILLDNGHGVNTAGKCSPPKSDGTRFREYKYAREIVDGLEVALKKLGYNVYKVTPEQNDISLVERVKRINKVVKQQGAGNCIMISIHNDAAGNGSSWMNARGWSAYTTRGQNNSDKVAECLYNAAEELLLNDKEILKSYSGELHKLFRKNTSDGDKDIEADFYIIKGANCPAVLTENFFQDNKKDVELMESQHGKDLIIQLHVNGIEKYVKSKKK